MVTGAIIIASLIQLVRGYRLLIVIVGLVTFLIVGNALVYLSGAKERKILRQRKRDYYAGKS